MKKITTFCFGILLLLSSCQDDSEKKQPELKEPEYQLVWSDEFNIDGLPDSTKWSYDFGDGCPNLCGWGNEEEQFYTKNRLKNTRVADGHLFIEAHKEKFKTRKYTSARLISKDKGDWLYGKVEIRAKMPAGAGTWAALWLLPTDWEYGGWPKSGEIDIVEYVGFEQDSVYGTIHTEAYNHGIGTEKSGQIFVKNASTEFHTYVLEWTEDALKWSINGEEYYQIKNERETFTEWPFDKRFYLLMNVAVGGSWGGRQGIDNDIFPQKMVVDYVRIYQRMPQTIELTVTENTN